MDEPKDNFWARYDLVYGPAWCRTRPEGALVGPRLAVRHPPKSLKISRPRLRSTLLTIWSPNASKIAPKSIKKIYIKNQITADPIPATIFVSFFTINGYKCRLRKHRKTLSLYWYLQYLAALSLFASIRLWLLIWIEISINFTIQNQPKSIKKTI